MDNSQLTEKTLLELFGDRETEYDVYGGTVKLENRERQVFITTETIYGLYKALNDETGDAWRVVMKNCGYLWGKRLVKNIERDVAARMQKKPGYLDVDSFVDLIQAYFAYHGWGRLHINLDHAESDGIILVQLKDSVVSEALKDTSGIVDYVIAGMLRAVFEYIADRELDCIQITCNRRATTSHCEFLVSSPQRIEALEPLAGQSTIDDAINELKAA